MLAKRKTVLPLMAVCSMAAVTFAQAQSPYESSADFAKYAMKLRAQALLKANQARNAMHK